MTCMFRSGMAPTSSPMNSRTPSGASTSTWPRRPRPPAAHIAVAPSYVVRVDRLEVPPRDHLGFVADRTFAPRRAWRTFAATSCTFAAASLALSSSPSSLSLATLPEIRSLVSLPVAEASDQRSTGQTQASQDRPRSPSWGGANACCRRLSPAPAAALARRAPLQRVGGRGRRRGRAVRHGDAPARLAREPGTGDADVRSDDRGRAPGGLHARALRPLWPGRDDRAAHRLRAVDAPQPRAHEALGRGPRRRAGTSPGGRAPERRARGAAAPLRRRAGARANRGSPA